MRKNSPVLLVTGILVMAACLRAPITVVSPLLDVIRADIGLDASQAGMLTTLPLLAFAIVSPFAAGFARRWGVERALFGALLILGAGIVARSVDGSAAALYGGTAVMGAAIAVANVLLPSLLKRDFPQHVARLTACYAFAMIAAAGAASALAVPLHAAIGGHWTAPLASVALLPAIAALLWLPLLPARQPIPAPVPPSAAPVLTPHARRRRSVWHEPLAWQVAIYLGLTCFVFFAALAWLPSILHDVGYSPARAGTLHGWMQLGSALPSLLLLPVLKRMPDQRAAALVSPAISAVGLAGLIMLPHGAVVWVFLLGMGMGAALILSLAFVGLRAGTQRVAAALSGMSQCVGYLLAAVGPTLCGILHENVGGWTPPLALCIVLTLLMCGLGWRVGQAVHIDDHHADTHAHARHA